MSKYSFKNDRQSIKHVIDRLLDNRNLSNWEEGFIGSIKKYYDDGGFLSDKQLQTLSNLWEKY